MLASFSAQFATARETSSLLQVLRGVSEIVSRSTPPPSVGASLPRELFSAIRNSSLLQRLWVRGSQPGMQVKSAVCATSLPWESTSVALTSGPRLDSISW